MSASCPHIPSDMKKGGDKVKGRLMENQVFDFTHLSCVLTPFMNTSERAEEEYWWQIKNSRLVNNSCKLLCELFSLVDDFKAFRRGDK